MSDSESLFSFEDVDEGRRVVVIDEVPPKDGLVDWYTANKRDLPWRASRDGYGVWVSEVMLQQTKVTTVIEYWKKWMQHYPTIADVAAAPLDDVKGMWAGLGYYRRAENLQKGCQYVVSNHSGILPITSVKHLLKVPGIGAYTAGAIASIAGGIVTPSVDGNFVRVISRWHGMQGVEQNPKSIPKIDAVARKMISPSSPGEWNQSIMDIGATICTPMKVNCTQCPLAPQCKARKMLQAGDIEQIEGTIPLKKEKAKTTKQMWTVVVPLVSPSTVLLVKRPSKGLLAGMWEFPNTVVKVTDEPPKKKRCAKTPHVVDVLGAPSMEERLSEPVTVYHQFTHIDCTLSVHKVDVTEAELEAILEACSDKGTETAIRPVAEVLGKEKSQHAVSEQMKKVLRACNC